MHARSLRRRRYAAARFASTTASLAVGAAEDDSARALLYVSTAALTRPALKCTSPWDLSLARLWGLGLGLISVF
jgi:hypothetical protein